MTRAETKLMNLPPEPASVGSARRFVRRVLADSRVSDELIDNALLMVSELVTNAVIHTDTPIEVRVAARPEVRIEVRDGSPLPPKRRSHDAESITGRGLDLVASLASEFGVLPAPPGKVVWFALNPSSAEQEEGSWDSEAAAPAPSIVVQLQHLPVRLYEVMREEYEALLREYNLAQFALDPATDAEPRDLTSADRSRLLIAEAFNAWKARQDPARLPAYADLRVPIPPGREPSFELLHKVVQAADELASQGRVLTPAPVPELVCLRDWILAEVAGQLAGHPPIPWTLPDDSVLESPPSVDVDLSWVDAAGECVVVVDAANRVIAASPAMTELLGWEVDDLVGKRVTRVIPPRLRETHLAGFIRHLLTGASRLLDREVTLPALRRDGQEVAVRMNVTKQVHSSGETIFVTRLAGIPPAAGPDHR